MYKIDRESGRPRTVLCETPGYPNRDAEGDMMYENSHWKTEKEAWGWLLRDREARISLAAHAVRDAEHRLLKAREEAATAACELVEAKEDHESWLRKRPRLV